MHESPAYTYGKCSFFQCGHVQPEPLCCSIINPDTGEPRIYAHGVEANEVEDALIFRVRIDVGEECHGLQLDGRAEAATCA